MKHSTRWNRDFRPRTYWLQSADEYLKHRPKGTVRRRMLESADSLGSVPGWRSEQSLSDQDRHDWSGRHPMMMGGEYSAGIFVRGWRSRRWSTGS